MSKKMKSEYDLGRMKKRNSVKTSKDLKVSKTIRLDVDVLEWLQNKAEDEGVGYQTFLNSFLKKAMKSQVFELEDIVRR